MKTIFLTVLLFTAIEFASAQSISKSVVATAGDSYTNTGEDIVLSWTIGQTVTGTFLSGDGMLYLSQGFHTGVPLGGVGLEEYLDNTTIDNIYPNPTRENVYLELSETVHGKTIFRIYNAQGELVKSQLIEAKSRKTEINLQGVSPGIYFITAIFENGDKTDYKIVKQ